MTTDLYILAISAISVAFLHTLLVPDHYLPFIVMQRAGKWSIAKTYWVTILCGIGHVGSSVLLGLVGVAFGVAIHKIQYFETFRGNIAALMFVAFGLAYMVWGLRKAYKNKPHTHQHFHIDGNAHSHTHTHFNEHSHVHANTFANSHTHTHKEEKANLTPWILFTIFVFGPCEPLIPIVMYPAAKGNYFEMTITTIIFGIITIATMLTVVMLSVYGLKKLPLKKLERFNHALAGAAIFFSGLAILVLGL